nr:MAG TPA: hypothetical protein [Microviridae sp.]
MALDWLLEDAPAYVSRGQRILSVLEGSGSVDVLPGRPDVMAEPSDFEKGEKFNPDIDFDPNSFSRMDKFDGLEVGQELIDSEIDRSKAASKSAGSEEK